LKTASEVIEWPLVGENLSNLRLTNKKKWNIAQRLGKLKMDFKDGD